MGNKATKLKKVKIWNINQHQVPSEFSTKLDIMDNTSKQELLVAGYCKSNNQNIAKEIISICNSYFDVHFTLLDDLPRNAQNDIIIPDSQEYIFQSLSLPKHTTIIAQDDALRITIIDNLEMKRNCSIRCKNDKCKIILWVKKDISMDMWSEIVCEKKGDIYIQCESLTMKERTKIQIQTLQQKDETDCNGNIYILAKNKMDISGSNISIFGGSFEAVAETLKIKDKSYIKALTGDVDIKCRSLISESQNATKSLQAKDNKLSVKYVEHVWGNRRYKEIAPIVP